MSSSQCVILFVPILFLSFVLYSLQARRWAARQKAAFFTLSPEEQKILQVDTNSHPSRIPEKS